MDRTHLAKFAASLIAAFEYVFACVNKRIAEMKIGIDLGSSNTVAALVSADGVATLIPDVNRLGSESTPTKVLIGNERAFVGEFAERMLETFPDQLMLTQFKRHFGSTVSLANWKGNQFSAEALAAMVLRKVRNDVEISTSRPVQLTVITAPAHFNDKQRAAIVRAADIAGLPVGAILDEPIAAALFYTHEAKNREDEIIMIYDLGGGTFDLTLLTYSANKLHIIAKAGLSDLGGRDFDDIVFNQLTQDYERVVGQSINKNKLSENRMRVFSEQLKIKVNGENPSWCSGDLFLNNKFVQFNLDEVDFLSHAAVLLDRTQRLVTRTLQSIGMQLGDVQQIVLTGGASNASYVYNYWQRLINPSKQKIVRHQPLVSIAKGAAIFAASLNDAGEKGFVSSYNMRNVSAYNVGVRVQGTGTFIKLIDRNLPLPISGSSTASVTGSSNAEVIFDLCQYIDQPDALDVIGSVRLSREAVNGLQSVHISVENKEDGTLGLKVKSPHTGQPVPFRFDRQHGIGSDFNAIKEAVRQMPINAF